MSETLTIQSPSEILYKRILIAMLASKRAHKLYMMADWRKRNPDAKLNWDANNKAHVRSYVASYSSLPDTAAKRRVNARAWRIKNLVKVKAKKKAWKLNNPEKFRAMMRKTEKSGADRHPHLAMRKRLKASIGIYLKRIGGTKANQTSERVIGCDMRFFAKWIQSLFLPGMTFENRNLWQLDHIFPNACCGSNQQQLLLAQNYRNLRPLWKDSNRDKWCILTEDSLLAGFLCGLSEIHITKKGQATAAIVKTATRLGFSIFDKTLEVSA